MKNMQQIKNAFIFEHVSFDRFLQYIVTYYPL